VKKPKAPKLGKKEERLQAAAGAAEGSSWGDLVEQPAARN
jgi:hypothetical protein